MIQTERNTPMNDKLALLTRFTRPDSYNEFQRKPIRRDGYLYATNGWIAIRIADDAAIEASDTEKSPNLARVFEHGDVEFHPLPALPDAIKCPQCNGTGKEYLEDCEDCDGDGDFIHGNHRYDCKECNGDGKVKASAETTEPTPCHHCNGSGEADPRDGSQPIKIGGLHFQPYLLRMIAGLPNARIEHVTPPDATTLPAAHFVFDGGEGAVMPFKV